MNKKFEIDVSQALKESGTDVPTEEQLEEWERVHKKLNSDLSNRVEQGWNGANISEVIRPFLSPAGLKVAAGRGGTTVMELLKNMKNGVMFPWCQSMLGYDYITDEALDGLELERTFVMCRFLIKVIEVQKGDTAVIQDWIKRFAAVFSHLADHDKIEYGTLAPFMAMPLADLEAEKKVQAALSSGILDKDELFKIRSDAMSESDSMRIALMVYPYSHYENDELNEFLGNRAFVDEGELGTDDWTGLPE